MADWVSTAEGRHLSGRQKRDTKPEVELRRALHALGLRYRLQVGLTRGCTPDILLPRWRAAVFVDGCFWHSCPRHGRKRPWSGPNANLWIRKMETNRVRDLRSTHTAEELGWHVIRVWECEVNEDARGLAQRIARELADYQTGQKR